MILTEIAPAELVATLARYAESLPQHGAARLVFARIRASLDDVDRDQSVMHREAVALTEAFGMRPIPEAPQVAFSWDGLAVRTESEAAVLVHEVAHYQLASPARRALPDFGLGAGPETGRIEIAEAARRVEWLARETEEQMASLLGILWEIELGQPGILAFQEQNWLEGAGRPGTAGFFCATLQRLQDHGLVDEDGRPRYSLRISPDL
ncbi:MAG: hypothetical protein WDN69_29715 [Aliidongia sp.]